MADNSQKMTDDVWYAAFMVLDFLSQNLVSL